MKKIDVRNTELENEVEELKIERIKEKNDLNSKFEADKEKLAQIAFQLESSMEHLKKELEEAEEKASSSTGFYLSIPQITLKRKY